MSDKLTRGGLTLGEMYKMSLDLYRSGKIDNKKRRANLDVVSTKILALKNFEYNKVTKAWEDIQRRSVKFELIVKTKPISYKRRDKLSSHMFPITLILYSIEDGLNSEFRYRSGSLKKPLFAKKDSPPSQRLKLEEQNIRNGIDLHFFYFLEYILAQNKLLYGINWARKAPVKTNPKGYVYMEKHFLWAFENVIIPILRNPKAINKITGKLFKK